MRERSDRIETYIWVGLFAVVSDDLGFGLWQTVGIVIAVAVVSLVLAAAWEGFRS